MHLASVHFVNGLIKSDLKFRRKMRSMKSRRLNKSNYTHQQCDRSCNIIPSTVNKFVLKLVFPAVLPYTDLNLFLMVLQFKLKLYKLGIKFNIFGD